MGRRQKGRRRDRQSPHSEQSDFKGKRGAKGKRGPHKKRGRKAPGWLDEQAILDCLREHPGSPASAIAKELDLPGEAAREIAICLREMVDRHEAIEIRPGRYMVAGAEGEFPVVIRRNHHGDGLLAIFDEDRELPVDPAHSLGCEEGDQALAMLSEDGMALITRINKRMGRGLVGTLKFGRGQVRFIPDNRREGELPLADDYKYLSRRYNAGDRVIGKLLPDGEGQPLVHIERALEETSPDVADFELVCLSHDLPGDFLPPALKEAESAPDDFAVGEREDLRDTFIFTIDPETAKDFDDAISIEQLDDGQWRVGVHIADVSHFVRPGSALDQEACKRTTSIYLVNRVIPMLPESLSNGLCSLVPQQDRYALSVFIDMDRTGDIIQVRPCETVINSKHRLTYEQALAIIEKREKKDQWPRELIQTVRTCHHVAQGLRKERVRQGALNLYSVERSFVLDAEGEPVDIKQETGDVAHELIEEFMLLANRAIAGWLVERGSSCVFRVHGEPDEERMEIFAAGLEQYGIQGLEPGNRQSLQQVLARLEDEPPAARLVLNYLCLRCFQKAIYAVQNIGHYALSFKNYLHFTSPIRRYPDLLVHRLVKRELGLADYQDAENRLGHLDAMARQCSHLEQRAAEAERDLKGMKAARYLAGRLGQSFAGVVIGAAPHGMYVQMLETGLEGLIPMRELNDDFYSYDGDRQALVGGNTGRVLGLGHECEVQVLAVDVVRAEVTLGFAG